MYDSDEDFAGMQAALMRRSFKHFCIAALAPYGQKPAAHHLLMIGALQDLADNVGQDRVIFELPPGSAKSTYVSKLFPPWFMSRRSEVLVIGASATGKFAEKVSRDVQQIVRDMGAVLDYRLNREAVDEWTTNKKGEYIAVGVGGNAAGRRADLFAIDDPVPGRKEADSPIEREIVWRWYQSVVEARLRPGGKIVTVSTRWHEDDLVGRLLKYDAANWRRIRIRAQAVAGEIDPLGREPGEFLWGDDKYGFAKKIAAEKERLIRTCATREWYALYQQDPKPPEGSMFDVQRIGVVDGVRQNPAMAPPGPVQPEFAMPVKRRTVRAWDLAATDPEEGKDADYTAGVKLTQIGGRNVVEDVLRFRARSTEVAQMIRKVAELDGPDVTISIPQDPGQAGKAQVAYMTSILSGFKVVAVRPTGSKETRAEPIASQVSGYNVDIVRAPWNAPFLEELANFPHGDHDDQVDGLSDAFNAMTGTAAGRASVQSIY